MKITRLLTFVHLTLLSISLFAFSDASYMNNLNIGATLTPSDVKVFSILSYCSDSNKLNGDCVMPELQRLAQNEKNTLAATIVSEYSRALSEGKFNELAECRIKSHQDTNNTLGRCVLVMNYYALKEQSKEAGISNYELCLQGGLSALGFGGNMSARFLMSQVYKRSGNLQGGQIWGQSLGFKKGTEEEQLLKKCYF